MVDCSEKEDDDAAMLVAGRKVVATRRRWEAAVLAALLAAVVELRWAILNAMVGEIRDARIVAAVVNFILLYALFYESSIAELCTTCVIVGRRRFFDDDDEVAGYFVSTGTIPLSL